MKYIWYFPLESIKRILYRFTSNTWTYNNMARDVFKTIRISISKTPINNPSERIVFDETFDYDSLDLREKNNGNLYQNFDEDFQSASDVFRKMLELYFYVSKIKMTTDEFTMDDFDDIRNNTGKFALLDEKLVKEEAKEKLKELVSINRNKPAFKTNKFSLIKELKKEEPISLKYYYPPEVLTQIELIRNDIRRFIINFNFYENVEPCRVVSIFFNLFIERSYNPIDESFVSYDYYENKIRTRFKTMDELLEKLY